MRCTGKIEGGLEEELGQAPPRDVRMMRDLATLGFALLWFMQIYIYIYI